MPPPPRAVYEASGMCVAQFVQVPTTDQLTGLSYVFAIQLMPSACTLQLVRKGGDRDSGTPQAVVGDCVAGARVWVMDRPSISLAARVVRMSRDCVACFVSGACSEHSRASRARVLVSARVDTSVTIASGRGAVHIAVVVTVSLCACRHVQPPAPAPSSTCGSPCRSPRASR